MDENKVAKLKEAGYSVGRCCVLCVGFRPGVKGSLWGTCTRHSYQHGKHTGECRECSVIACGSCPSFEIDDTKVMAILGSYECLAEWRSMKKEEYKRPEPDPLNGEFITCEFCGCYTNAKLRRCCEEGCLADGGKR